jgi:hypothetical protein
MLYTCPHARAVDAPHRESVWYPNHEPNQNPVALPNNIDAVWLPEQISYGRPHNPSPHRVSLALTINVYKNSIWLPLGNP